MKNPELMTAEAAYYYALDVIEDRWLEAEKIIATDVHWAYRYARDVIEGRWLEAEEIIAQKLEYKIAYRDAFFPNQKVVTKDEIGEFEWNRLGLNGYFAEAELFKRPASLLDMIVES